MVKPKADDQSVSFLMGAVGGEELVAEYGLDDV